MDKKLKLQTLKHLSPFLPNILKKIGRDMSSIKKNEMNF